METVNVNAFGSLRSSDASTALPAPSWPRVVLRSAVLNAGIAVIPSMLTYTGGYAINFIYSQCIGLLIAIPIEIARRRVSSPNKFAWMAIIVFIASVLGLTVGGELGRQGCSFVLGVRCTHPLDVPGSFPYFIAGVTLLASAIGFYWFYSAARMMSLEARLLAEQAATERAQRQASEAQLLMLRAQIEPHMLFNTLANLRVLIGIDAERAQQMLDQLIRFLRATLSASQNRDVTVQEEFAILRDYLDLMRIRMGDRLEVELIADSGAAEWRIPMLLLQPLVENSIKHGLETLVKGGLIRVSAEVGSSGDLILMVRDHGQGFSPDSAEGYGLAHVRERLRTAFKDQASLEIVSPLTAEADPPGAEVRIRIPKGASR